MPVHDAGVARMVELDAELSGPYRRDRRTPGRGPQPTMADVLAFFVGLPLFLALWATAVGIGPARVLGFQYGFLYVGIQMTAAFGVSGGTTLLLRRLLRPWRPPVSVVLVAGFLAAWPLLYVFYLKHFAFFSQLFPEILAPAARRPPAGLHTDYLLHAMRYSLPFLPMWLAAVHGYRFVTGVQFFATASPVVERPPGAEAGVTVAACGSAAPAQTSAFLVGSRLPPGDVVLAIKAEEHYIRVWTSSGADLVRYRFGDALRDVADRDGAQIHRSWWINWASVTRCHQRGRSLELVLDNGLQVPVSLAHKAEVHRRLDERRRG